MSTKSDRHRSGLSSSVGLPKRMAQAAAHGGGVLAIYAVFPWRADGSLETLEPHETGVVERWRVSEERCESRGAGPGDDLSEAAGDVRSAPPPS